MKALVYTAPKTLSYQRVDEPIIHKNTQSGDDEQLIGIEQVGICGSDMHAYLGHDARRPAPLILGHEAAGVVLDGPDKGRRVTINPLVSCGQCTACRRGRANLCPDRQIISMQPRQGAFAERLSMPRRNLVTVPDHVPLEKAALAEPIACGWHAAGLATRALDIPLSEARCLVIGGGAIGVGAALSLQCLGSGPVSVVEPHDQRRDYLQSLGELSLCTPEAIKHEASYDVVMDCVGYRTTRELASQVTRAGGVVLHIGLGEASGGLDVRRMTLQEITFIGSYTYTPEDFQAVTEALFAGRLGQLAWTESRALSQGAQAFDDILAQRTVAPKILLSPA